MKIKFARSLKLIFCITALLFSLGINSQNELKKWYFGQYSGLDFMPSIPTPITHTTMIAFEGCASAADAAGNLLFYTDGVTVWNKQQLVMANGTGLLGNNSTAQSSLIVKQPGNTNIYFLFTLDAQGMSNGLMYSVINMTMAAGLGSVTTQNIPLYAPSMEQLTGTRHCNGTDVWVVSHQFNTNNFVSYLVTASGVNSVPVISASGNTLSALGQGMIKISPNGKRLGMTYFNGSPSTLQLFDFDNATGIVSNPMSLLNNQGNPYSCEFSPDGTKFYASVAATLSPIYQWNLCAGSSAAILNSQTGFGSSPVSGLQNGPDGKIYCSKSGSQLLGVINNPNNTGTACNYVNGGQSVSGSLLAGLPNFICSAFKQVNPFSYTVNPQVSCSSASFAVSTAVTNAGCNSANPPLINCAWNFGDPTSGTANTSTLLNPVHNYASAGSYTVKLIQYSACNIDTSRQVISIAATPTVTVSGNFSVCPGQTTTLTGSGANLYSWNSNTVAPTITISPLSSTSFSVVGTNTLNNCRSTVVITVTALSAPVLSVSGNFSVCNGQAASFTATGADTYTWNLTTIAPTITLSPVNNMTMSVIGTNSTTNCQSAKTITVTPIATPTLLVSGNFSICAGQQTTLTSTGANTYTWNTGLSNASIIVSPSSSTGYTVTGTNTNNCNGVKAVNVTVSDCVGIETNSQQDSKTVLYPNPFGDKLFVELNQNATLQIYNQLGDLVFQSILQKGKTDLDLSTLNKGIFFARIGTDAYSKTMHLIKTE